jgi:flagellar biosynthetic protein FliR
VTGLAAVAAGAARALPLVWLVPPSGLRAAKLLVAAGLAALAWPALAAAPAPSLPMFARELMVGLTLGLVAAVPFRAAEAAGALVGGALGNARAALAGAYQLLALALFGALSGPRLLALAWAQSYAAVPVGAPFTSTGIAVAIDAGARLVAAALALAAPVLGALLLADLTGALLLRAQPALGEVAGAPLRLLLALAVILLGLGTTLGVLAGTGSLAGLADAVHAASAALAR